MNIYGVVLSNKWNSILYFSHLEKAKRKLLIHSLYACNNMEIDSIQVNIYPLIVQWEINSNNEDNELVEKNKFYYDKAKMVNFIRDHTIQQIYTFHISEFDTLIKSI